MILTILDYIADARGIPSSDVRSCERMHNMHAWDVRLWNHRHFIVDALEVYRWCR